MGYHFCGYVNGLSAFSADTSNGLSAFSADTSMVYLHFSRFIHWFNISADSSIGSSTIIGSMGSVGFTAVCIYSEPWFGLPSQHKMVCHQRSHQSKVVSVPSEIVVKTFFRRQVEELCIIQTFEVYWIHNSNLLVGIPVVIHVLGMNPLIDIDPVIPRLALLASPISLQNGPASKLQIRSLAPTESHSSVPILLVKRVRRPFQIPNDVQTKNCKLSCWGLTSIALHCNCDFTPIAMVGMKPQRVHHVCSPSSILKAAHPPGCRRGQVDWRSGAGSRR
ncbi:hypothetical protein NPIL_484371 [Nephila pilipes]|uniref:Uncharacterized protein n=1 Tax=Nephila pilipes TaxID=299642 RepID=A0A8X6Q0D4_NEPPI|nr:hypothetical protein NPIL_484371 [Nephila pilipes]